MPPLVELRNVSKVYRLGRGRPVSLKEALLGRSRRPPADHTTIHALRNVSLTIQPGESLGLVGFNGSGKSTLLKIIAAITEPTTGTVMTRGRVASLLELGVGFHPEMTGRENVFINGSFLGLSEREVAARLPEIIEFAELSRFMDTPVKHYSSGMFLRLGFAVGICLDPDVLLIDEGFAVGDEAFQIKCVQRVRKLREAGKSLILVSHALSLVVELCNRAILLRDGEVAAEGSPPEVMLTYHRQVQEKTQGRTLRRLTAADVFTLDRGGNHRVELLSARLLDASGRERHQYGQDEGWTLELEFVAHQPVQDPKIVVAITDIERRPIFVTNNEAENPPLGQVEGRFRCRFRLERPNLMPGYYLVGVLVMPYHHDDQAADAGAGWLEDLYEVRNGFVGFYIMPSAGHSRYHWGVAYQAHRWEIEIQL
ncbi:ABC transporter ATP-binding protein [bacterium]|nr:ABC transporter ATP-binding protein [bacterium]